MDDVRENAVSATVDWLSFTVTWDKVRRNDWLTHDGQQVAVANLLELSSDWQRDIPLHGYEDCWLAKDAGHARVMVSRPGDRMGIHVQLPGQALRLLSPAKALRICGELAASVTRVDIAVDVRGVSEVSDVYGAMLAKTAVTRAQKYNMVIGNTGDTVYVGSRTSERFLRVYDKAAEQKIEGNWTRIEMECKGTRAKWVASYLMREGFQGIGSLIADYVDCPGVDWYTDALHRVEVDIGAPQAKKVTDTRAWLMGTVAKTLAKETREDEEFLMDFLRAVQKMRGITDETE